MESNNIKTANNMNMIKSIWIFAFGFVCGILLGLFFRSFKVYPGTHIDTREIVNPTIYFDSDEGLEGLSEDCPDLSSYIDSNYLRYLKKAYILMGSYPGCEMIKISPNVARNDIDWETEFYCDEGELYFRRMKNGEPSGKIGVDVSQFQGNIAWDRVKAAGIEVAIVRIGYRGYGQEGKIIKDSCYDANMSGASENGIETGVYFYSSAVNYDEGVEEAKFVLDNLGSYDITQPIVFDTEYVYENDNARTNNISVKDRTDATVGFCETIEAAGYTPMIYASRDHFVKYLDIDAIGKWEFWLAAYDTPVFPYHTEGYQYSPYGLVDGISGNVDLNVWMR